MDVGIQLGHGLSDNQRAENTGDASAHHRERHGYQRGNRARLEVSEAGTATGYADVYRAESSPKIVGYGQLENRVPEYRGDDVGPSGDRQETQSNPDIPAESEGGDTGPPNDYRDDDGPTLASD